MDNADRVEYTERVNKCYLPPDVNEITMLMTGITIKMACKCYPKRLTCINTIGTHYIAEFTQPVCSDLKSSTYQCGLCGTPCDVTLISKTKQNHAMSK